MVEYAAYPIFAPMSFACQQHRCASDHHFEGYPDCAVAIVF